MLILKIIVVIDKMFLFNVYSKLNCIYKLKNCPLGQKKKNYNSRLFFVCWQPNTYVFWRFFTRWNRSLVTVIGKYTHRLLSVQLFLYKMEYSDAL